MMDEVERVKTRPYDSFDAARDTRDYRVVSPATNTKGTFSQSILHGMELFQVVH